ncbi:radical SAM protein [Pelomyxa schiedti]|nr:radical SAM protein [Pelomyxa schiedti]
MQAVVVGAPEYSDTDPSLSLNPLLVEDHYHASVPFLIEYFTNGKNAHMAHTKVEEGKTRVHVMLGAVFIGQLLQRERGVKCHLVHTYCNSPAATSDFEEKVAASSIVLISTTLTTNWWFTEKIAQHAKRVNPQATVIAGGLRVFKSYISKVLEDQQHAVFLNPTPIFGAPFSSAVDFLIVSVYGQATLLSLYDSLINSDQSWKSLSNIAWYDHSQRNFHINTIEEEQPVDCEVDWSLVSFPQWPKVWYPVQVGQGCPLKCGFCDYGSVAPKMTWCTPESVFRTLESIPRDSDGFRRVLFTNDNLFSNKVYAQTFFKELISRHLGVVWKGFVRADSIQDEEMADLLKSAGCKFVFIGMESGDDTVLRNMQKHCTAEMIRKCVLLLLSRGIIVRLSLVVGFPGETKQTWQNTMDFLNSIPPIGCIEVQPFPLVVSPLAPVGQQPMRQTYGLKGLWATWSHNTMSSSEASAIAKTTPGMLLPHLSVCYDTDSITDDIAHINTDFRREVYRLRNLLAREQRTTGTTNPQLWAQLESAVLSMITSASPPHTQPPTNAIMGE